MAGVPLIHIEVPTELHRQAKAKAAIEGMTLKAFIIEALAKAVADKPKGRR